MISSSHMYTLQAYFLFGERDISSKMRHFVLLFSLVREEALPHMGYIGMCSPKGCGFSAVLVIRRM